LGRTVVPAALAPLIIGEPGLSSGCCSFAGGFPEARGIAEMGK